MFEQEQRVTTGAAEAANIGCHMLRRILLGRRRKGDETDADEEDGDELGSFRHRLRG